MYGEMPSKKKVQKGDSSQSHSRKLKGKNLKERSHKRMNMIAALKTNNKSLAAALDEARKDYRKVKEENLILKQERQQLLERVAGFESKVQERQTQHVVEQHGMIMQPALELLKQAQKKIEQAMQNLSRGSNQSYPPRGEPIALSPIIDVSKVSRHQVHFEQTSDLQKGSSISPKTALPKTPYPLYITSGKGPQLASTPVPADSKSSLLLIAPGAIRFSDSETTPATKGVSPREGEKPKGNDSSPGMPENGNGSSNTEENTTFTELESNLLGGRPKRRCTSFSVSYQEPSLSKKLRRGDPFTEKTVGWSPACHKRKKKKRRVIDTAHFGMKQRKALQELTNHK